MAVSERFELSIGFNADTPLAGERLRPLGQLTILVLLFTVELYSHSASSSVGANNNG